MNPIEALAIIKKTMEIMENDTAEKRHAAFTSLFASMEDSIVTCKDCKYFVDDYMIPIEDFPLPIIAAHEICTKWGASCKVKRDGWCFMAERKDASCDAGLEKELGELE